MWKISNGVFQRKVCHLLKSHVTIEAEDQVLGYELVLGELSGWFMEWREENLFLVNSKLVNQGKLGNIVFGWQMPS